MFRRLYDWLTLRDYERAKQESTRRIVARLSSNVLMSQGRYMTKDDLDRAAEKVDSTVNPAPIKPLNIKEKSKMKRHQTAPREAKKMNDVVDLQAARKAQQERDNTPPEHLTQYDRTGKPMYKFSIDYTHTVKMNGVNETLTFCVELWAYDREDAERRMKSIAANGKIEGAILHEEPARL